MHRINHDESFQQLFYCMPITVEIYVLVMPTEETLKKNVTVRNGYLNASVAFLKVYPKPVCNCTFQVSDIPFQYRMLFNINE